MTENGFSVLFRAFVPPSAPPDRYRVRLRYGDARSGWVDLKIAEARASHVDG
jgi:hypothetical protein